ncbi:MAG: hypothetical protein WBQ25_24435 [Nitrososphaeraceae archaeon]
MKITTKDQAIREIDYSKHPNYDEVCKKMRKLLGSAESFIPDAAEGLRQDWYSELSQEHIKHDSIARNDIRDHIFNDWSHERNQQGVWGDRRIQFCFPDWLRDPSRQTEEFIEGVSKKGGQAKKLLAAVSLQKSLAEQQRPAIERLIEKLPEPIILPEEIPELQIPDEPEGSNEPLDAATVREITIHQHDTELTAAEQAILKALKNKEHLRHLFNEIASSSDNTLAKLSINGHMEKLDKIRSLVDNALSILQDIKV